MVAAPPGSRHMEAIRERRMGNKRCINKVTLPKDWNSLDDMPKDLVYVIVKFQIGYAVAFANSRLDGDDLYYASNGQPIPHTVIGWAEIVEQ